MEFETTGEINFISNLNGRIVFFEDGKYIPLLTIILNGNEKIFYKDYSILHILDVTLRNPNDGELYLGDIKLYDNKIDTDASMIFNPYSFNEVGIIVNCQKNNYGELFTVIIKEKL